MRGVPYKKITEKSGLTVEKVLLSLGWLESIGLVDHDVAVVRKTLDYLGQTNIEVAGQSVVRMFYLTEKGSEALEFLKKGRNE
jgi:high-affinity nickel permease